MMEAALSFLYRLSDIELILIGVTSLKEFKEILKIWRSCKDINRKLSRIEIDCSWIKSDEIDPRVWSTKN